MQLPEHDEGLQGLREKVGDEYERQEKRREA